MVSMSVSRSMSSTASYNQPIAGPNAAPHATIAIGVGRVEERAPPLVECATQHGDGLVVTAVPPPACGERPGTEADLRHGDVSAGKCPISHGLKASRSNRTPPPRHGPR